MASSANITTRIVLFYAMAEDGDRDGDARLCHLVVGLTIQGLIYEHVNESAEVYMHRKEPRERTVGSRAFG